MPKPTRAEVLAEYLGLTEKQREQLKDVDPLAPGTEADAWLGVLVRRRDFAELHDGFKAMLYTVDGHDHHYHFGRDDDPTPAIVRAMMAADSTFAAKMEGAEG